MTFWQWLKRQKTPKRPSGRFEPQCSSRRSAQGHNTALVGTASSAARGVRRCGAGAQAGVARVPEDRRIMGPSKLKRKLQEALTAGDKKATRSQGLLSYGHSHPTDVCQGPRGCAHPSNVRTSLYIPYCNDISTAVAAAVTNPRHLGTDNHLGVWGSNPQSPSTSRADSQAKFCT